MEGKRLFEQHMDRMGYKITHYHADNEVFALHDWSSHCSDNMQQLAFAAVRPHHMNGVADSKIKQLPSLARTMTIHAN